MRKNMPIYMPINMTTDIWQSAGYNRNGLFVIDSIFCLLSASQSRRV